MQWIRRGRLEFGQVQVELTSPLTFSVDEDRSHANFVACSCGLLKSVLHECLPQSSSPLAEVDPESTQEDNRRRMLAGTTLDALWGQLPLNRTSRQGVVADDTARSYSTDDVDSARACSMRLKGMLSQPVYLRP